jgi:hypothetical protein
MWGSSGSVSGTSTSDALAQAVTDMWYNGEYEAFPWADLGQPDPDMSNFDAWGHFSQVVWAGSTTCGCATQYCAAGSPMGAYDSYFTVCNYGPPGKLFITFWPVRKHCYVLTA